MIISLSCLWHIHNNFNTILDMNYSLFYAGETFPLQKIQICLVKFQTFLIAFISTATLLPHRGYQISKFTAQEMSHISTRY